jgi:tape measure domain-containing protein
VANVDERVVSASFETSKFEAGAQKMLHSLDVLKKALNFPEAGKGLNQINAAANKTDLSHISRGIDELKGKFNSLRLVGIATLANIATKAVSAGTQFVKQFTFQPVIDGLHEYQDQLNAVQTILANTQSAGTNLKDVNGALNQLNHYADKTIYNFSQMTKNIGTFTAAGVDLKTSVTSIKGIANLAALSGSNAEQASTAMYQLSQAISAGRVSLQDWNSVVNAGMGGTVFQRALAQTAVKMGTLGKNAVQLKGKMKNVSIEGQSFRESIQAGPGKKSWLTSDVLTKTLSQFSGDLSNAQLKAQGFNDAEIKAIQAQAKTALNAATQVKTLSQLIDTTKEAIGSGWAQTFQIIFGDFGEAKKLFTSLSNFISGFVSKQANARNAMLQDWKKLGGRDSLLKGLKQGFNDILDVLRPIHEAFRDVFPKKTGRDLADFTQRFEQFTAAIKPSPETVDNLRRTFRGLFALLDIGKQVVGGIFHVIGQLFGALGKGSGGFLNLTGSVGDYLTALDKSLKKTGAITNFFATIGSVLQKPIDLISKFGHAISQAFSGNVIGKGAQSMSLLQRIIENVSYAWDQFVQHIQGAPNIFKPALEGISQMFGGLGDAIAQALKGANFDAVFKVLEVGLLGGIFLTLKKALSGGLGNALAGGVLKSIVQAFTGVGGLTKSIGGTFNALTGSIQTMQQNVKSDTLKNIAISIALLSASIVGLSLVDPKRLNSALSAITIGFGQLLGAMAIMDKIGKSGGFVKMPVIAGSMILLAGAIDLLAIAVLALSRLSWDQLVKGLGGVAVLLGTISAASGPLSANSAGMIRASIGIGGIAIAMNILARAVKTFGEMDLSTLAKGIGAVAASLVAIGAAANLFPSGMVAMGVGLIAVGAGLNIIATAVAKLGGMNVPTLAKGIGAIALALTAIGLAMRLMPGPSMVVTAAGLVLVSVALRGIAKAIGTMGGMSIEQIAKGLGTLAASLTLLTIALYAMSGTLAGSAALAVAAAGIAILAPALKSLGDQSWGQIVKGMVALAAAFGLLGVAGIALAPVAPAILALGAALIAVGAGLALAGAGVALIGIGLGAIAVAGPAAVKILVDALVQLAEALPKVIGNLVKALLQLVKSVADAAPKFVDALGKILVAMARAIIVAAPQLTKAFTAILQLIFKVIEDNFPDLVKTGFDMLKALLQGIINNISRVTKMVITIVSKFLGAIASNLSKIVGGGANILVALLKGIANNISKVVTAAGSIITKFVQAIGSSLSKLVAAGATMIVKILSGVSNNIGRVIRSGTNVIVKWISGISNAGAKIVSAGVAAAGKFVNAIAKGAVRMADEGAKAVIRFLNGVADVIKKREPEMIRAGGRIGVAFVQGLVDAVSGLGGKLLKKIASEIGGLPGKGVSLVKKALAHLSASLPLPDGLGKAFGITFTNAVIGELGTFESEFQKELATVGGASNIDFLYNLGNDLASTFKDGLLSGMEREAIDPIKQAGSDIVKQIAGNQTDIENSILESNQKIRDANHALDNDYEALRKARTMKDKQDRANKIASINQDIKDQKAVRAEAVKTLLANEQLLGILSKTSSFILLDPSYQTMINKLAAAKQNVNDLNIALDAETQKLNDLKAARQSLFDQTFEKFSALPGIVATDENGNPIDPATQVQNYINSLSNADDVVGVFTNSLNTLQNMGLNADTYQQLLDIGPAAQGFVDALIAMGPGAIEAINAADNDLKNAARILADRGADEMYGAGIATAQGIVDGLKVKIPEAIKAAEDLAEAIVKAIKKKLKIKSPSQVFAEIGRYSVEGMAKGLSDSSKKAVAAAYGVTDDVVKAMNTGLSGISNHIDTNPVIKPVLDLTDIQNGSKTLSSILGRGSIAVGSFGVASSIAVDQAAKELAKSVEDGSVIKFEQNNYSPKSLSNIEIYRQTKNQLSQAKPVLAS